MMTRLPVFATRSTSSGDTAKAHISGRVFCVSVSRVSNCRMAESNAALYAAASNACRCPTKTARNTPFIPPCCILTRSTFCPGGQHPVVAVPHVHMGVERQHLRVNRIGLHAHRVLRRRATLRPDDRRHAHRHDRQARQQLQHHELALRGRPAHYLSRAISTLSPAAPRGPCPPVSRPAAASCRPRPSTSTGRPRWSFATGRGWP